MEGRIKIHRKILENPIICKDSDYLAVWIYLLLNATHKEIPALFKGKKIILQKGQLIVGRKSMANQLKISESKIYRIINCFKSEQQIEQQTSNQNSLITVLNWDKYQQIEQQNEQPMNNERTTDEQRVNTNKNVKNVRMKECKNVVEEVKEEIDSCVDGFQKVIDFYNNNIGLITPFAVEILQDYAKEMDLDVIIYALEKSVSANARNLNFIKAILNNWSKKGIKTLLQAQEENQQFHLEKTNKEITKWRSEENQKWRKEWLNQDG